MKNSKKLETLWAVLGEDEIGEYVFDVFNIREAARQTLKELTDRTLDSCKYSVKKYVLQN